MKNWSLLPLGGLGEIGMNCMVLENEKHMYLIDCGSMANHNDWLGFDFIVPRFDYIKEHHDKLRSLILTHGHEDHIGGIAHLLSEVHIPKIIASKMTIKLLMSKLQDRGVESYAEILEIEELKKYKVQDIEVEYIPITHSYAESYATCIHTKIGKIVHSGDFKLDPKAYRTSLKKSVRLKEIGDESCLLLMSDSTNAEREGFSNTDENMFESLFQAMVNCSGKIIVTCFASNVHRLQMFIDLARKLHRKIYFHGRSMNRFLDLGRETKHLDIRDEEIGKLSEIESQKRSNVFILTTGSQGEKTSGLVRIAHGEDKDIGILNGDRVLFSSLKIPGNEINIRYLMNELARKGADVIHDPSIHASGHAYKEELRQMLEWVRPKFFLPVHGDYQMLCSHAALAKETQIPQKTLVVEDGFRVSFNQDEFFCSEDVAGVGKRWTKGLVTGALNDPELVWRKRVARDGLVIVQCYHDGERFLQSPVIQFHGFLISNTMRESLFDTCNLFLNEVFQEYNENLGISLQEFMQQKVRKACRKICNTKPQVIILDN